MDPNALHISAAFLVIINKSIDKLALELLFPYTTTSFGIYQSFGLIYLQYQACIVIFFVIVVVILDVEVVVTLLKL